MRLTSYLLIMISYIIGCFNTGYYYTRFFYQKDVRSFGTNVTGATNVSRVAGKKGFAVTFLGDSLKGALIVFICRLIRLSEITTLWCILAVIAGHIFPFQLRFRGGKGISTMFGAFLAYDPLLILYLLITCVIIYPFVRRFTITSLFAMILLPLELLLMDREEKEIIPVLFCMLVIIYACRGNLKEFLIRKSA